MGVEAISESKSNFVSRSNAALVMANRYDGVDFPHKQCRLLVLEGLPKSQNLQEKFLLTKMGCSSLFADRIKTRITQAFGRCTRANSDFAAVFILGDEWMDYLLEPKNRNLLHPEIQAELIFGDDQSKTSLEEVLENLQVFLEQKSDWQDAAEDIVEIRNECNQVIPEE
jgi:Rad3-related DNA helicase